MGNRRGKKKRLRKGLKYIFRADRPAAEENVFVNRALRRKLARKGKS